MTIRLEHSRVYAADCADCETRDGMLDRIESAISLEGPLDEGQRARLLEIAQRCPVHRTLTSEIDIGARLTDHLPGGSPHRSPPTRDNPREGRSAPRASQGARRTTGSSRA